jgi:REP element-mobilizing transposase RayT
MIIGVLDSNVSHTYISDLVHCVFSTKRRRNLILPQIQPDLWAFLGGIAHKNGFKALIVGGTENHVHILLSLPVHAIGQSHAVGDRRVVAMDERNPYP